MIIWHKYGLRSNGWDIESCYHLDQLHIVSNYKGARILEKYHKQYHCRINFKATAYCDI